METKKSIQDVYYFMHEGISSVVNVSNDLLSLNKGCSDGDVLSLLFENLKKLDYFDSFAFYEIKNLIEFEQTYCYPKQTENSIEQDVEGHINNGTFAWILNTNKPTVFSGPVSGLNQILFSLSTKRRIHGMFIANAKNKGEVSGILVDILQLILSITIFSIDNLHLTEQLTDYAEDLENTVSQRTLELQKAVSRAEMLDKTRAEFLANMSHEIRTPMNGVLGMMDLLKETPLSKKQLHYVTTAKSSGSNMLVILNDILDLSKVESGKLVIEEEEFNIINTISDLVSLFSIELQKKGVEFIVSIDPIIPTYLLGGQTRFWQIVMNLLGNAKKFTKKGEICLTLTLNDLQNNEVDILVSVKDSGIGISKDSIGKIFQSFEQAEVNTSRHYGGTGLGLTLCKKLTEMMGGDINVKSVLGEGSEFYFNTKMKRVFDAPKIYLFEKNNFNSLILSSSEKAFSAINNAFDYLHVKHEVCNSLSSIDEVFLRFNAEDTNVLFVDEFYICQQDLNIDEIKNKYASLGLDIVVFCDEVNKEKHSSDMVLTKPLQIHDLHSCLQSISNEVSNVSVDHSSNNEKIYAKALIVEDNEVNQMVVSGFLENIGCDFIVTNNGEEGIEFMRKDDFDIVFMDINMPVLGGREATIAYRKTEADDKHLPIIALTANVLPEDVATYYDAGMDDYIPKPFSPDKLREIITKWVPQSYLDNVHEQLISNISNDNHIDKEITNSLKKMMGKEKYEHLISTFTKRCAILKDDLKNNKDDTEKFIRDIHTLKGSAGTMGAKQLSSMCGDFEHNLRNEEGMNRDSEVDKILKELDITLEHLLR